MKIISTSAELMETIHLLETKKIETLQEMKNDFSNAYDHFKPANLLKSTIKKFGTSPSFHENLITVGLALFAGFLSNKALSISGSNSKSRKLLGLMMQLGVANLVIYGPNLIKSLLQSVSDKRKNN